MELKRTLQWYWPLEPVQIGPVCFTDAIGIQNHPWIEALIADKILPLGDCPNGDLFVVDFDSESCPVGYVTHEEFDGESNPRRYFQPVFRTLESYLNRIAEQMFVPTDFYDARDFVGFLLDETNHDRTPPFLKRT